MSDVTAERDPKIEDLRAERDPRGVLDEDVRYYTSLGVLLEQNVRGLIREWQAGR